MDLSTTIAPKSDQLNADDLISGPQVFTITAVKQGDAEQPVWVELAECPGRPWKPSKSMRRVLVAAWGKDSTVYPGRSVMLYRDPSVRFGRDEVGGIKVSHMSDLTEPLKVMLTVTRGKRELHVVEPLKIAPRQPEPSADEVAACADTEALRAMWATANAEGKALIEARVKELQQQGEVAA